MLDKSGASTDVYVLLLHVFAIFRATAAVSRRTIQLAQRLFW